MENRRLSLLYNLQNLYNSSEFESVEYTISKYLIDNYLNIRKMNIFDVAEDNNVSRATIRRFCQNLGYENFKELKYHFNEFDEGVQVYNSYYSQQEFMTKLKNDINNMFTELEERLSTKELNQIVDMIYKTDEIIIIASSTIANSIRVFQQTMAIFKKRVSIVVDEEDFYNISKHLSNESLMLLFSISGLFAETFADIVHNSGVKCYLFTNSRNPIFNQYYTRVYHLSAMENQHLSSIIYYTYGVSFVLDSILNRYLHVKERIKHD